MECIARSDRGAARDGSAQISSCYSYIRQRCYGTPPRQFGDLETAHIYSAYPILMVLPFALGLFPSGLRVQLIVTTRLMRKVRRIARIP
jgi:hypothetical protein